LGTIRELAEKKTGENIITGLDRKLRFHKDLHPLLIAIQILCAHMGK
jgi:hypothetical protein